MLCILLYYLPYRIIFCILCYICHINAAFDLASIGADTQITCSSETPKSCAQSDVLKSEGIYATMCA